MTKCPRSIGDVAARPAEQHDRTLGAMIGHSREQGGRHLPCSIDPVPRIALELPQIGEHGRARSAAVEHHASARFVIDERGEVARPRLGTRRREQRPHAIAVAPRRAGTVVEDHPIMLGIVGHRRPERRGRAERCLDLSPRRALELPRVEQPGGDVDRRAAAVHHDHACCVAGHRGVRPMRRARQGLDARPSRTIPRPRIVQRSHGPAREPAEDHDACARGVPRRRVVVA